MNILLQAIKLIPRFLLHIYFQPSKVHSFINKGKKNRYIYIWSSIFQGLLVGILLSITHYLWYNNIQESIIFGVGIAVVVAFAGAFAVAFAGAFTYAFTFAFAAAYAIAFVAASAVAFAVAVTVVVAVIGVGTGVAAELYPSKQKKSALFLYIVINSIIIFFIVAISFEPQEKYKTENFELLLPLAYMLGALLVSPISYSKGLKQIFEKPNQTSRKLLPDLFKKFQIALFLWCILFSFSSLGLIFFNGSHKSMLINLFLGFLIISPFTLHIPDTILCLPIWRHQREQMLKQPEDHDKLIHLYKSSILFKHQMIYFPLPGLHRAIVAISRNKDLGSKEAIRHLTRLYLYTFQQEEALKAFDILQGENNSHLLIHNLIIYRNIPLLKTFSKKNPLVSLYLELFEDKCNILDICTRMKQVMDGDDDIHLSMIHSLETAHKLITTAGLNDLQNVLNMIREMTYFPKNLKYFIVLKNTTTQLIIILRALKKSESIQRFETKRGVLAKQKKQLDSLAKSTATNLYEPFSNLWQRAIINCAKLVEKELHLLQGSAIFNAQLINRELHSGTEEQFFHFQIANKGQELGQDVKITFQAESPSLTATDKKSQTITFFETGGKKTILFPVLVHHPGKATVKLLLTYSDHTRKNKQEKFAFPITIREKPIQFKKIENPYTAGPALRKDSPLFIGRADIYRYVNENIIPSGQHHTLVCHGLRRTGKSSLLYQIEKKGLSDKRLVPFNIDLQGISDEKDFYLTLSEKIINRLNLSSIEPVDNFGDFKRFIQKTASLSDGKIMVLMLDEFEELQMRVEEKRIDRTIFSNIRHLMQHDDHIIFLFCGTHKIEEMQANYWSIFFNTALYKRIGKLPREDAIRLIKEPVAEDLDYDDLAVDHILAMTGCQPYLIQLLCRQIVNDLNHNKKRNDALVNDVDDAVAEIIAEDNDNFSKEAWKESGYLERMILSATAEQLTHQHQEQINLEDILFKIEPLMENFSREKALDTLDKLVYSEILTEKNLNYRFTVNMMRQWITTRHPLRKVRN